jgi:hypothetical protein
MEALIFQKKFPFIPLGLKVDHSFILLKNLRKKKRMKPTPPRSNQIS